MSALTNSSLSAEAAIIEGNQNQTFGLVMLTSLFFLWGFITCLNDILIPHLKILFSLSYTQSMLIQFCFFGAFLILSTTAISLTDMSAEQLATYK